MYDRVPRQKFWRRNREKGLPDNYVMIDTICVKGREPGQKPMYMGSEEITISGEMMVLRCMSGVTKLNRIRNETIKGIAKVGEI